MADQAQDFSHLSDDQLKAIVSQKPPDFSHLSDDELMKIVSSKPDGGFIGKFQDAEASAIHTLAQAHHSPLAGLLKGADFIMNSDSGKKVAGYAGGMARTGLAGLADLVGIGHVGMEDYDNAAAGNAAPSSEFLKRTGVPEGKSFNVPLAQTLIGRPASVSARDAAGALLDGATDPLVLGTSGGMGTAAKKVGAAAGDAAASGAKTAMTTFLGPSRETIDSYLNRAAHIDTAVAPEEIKNQVDRIYGNYLNDIQQAGATHAEAQKGLDEINSNLRSAHHDAGFNLRDTNWNLTKGHEQAQKALSESFAAAKGDLSAVKSPAELHGDVHSAIADLKHQVVQGSNEAYGILEKDPGAYSVRGAAPILRQAADEMNIQPFSGTSPSNGQPGLVTTPNFVAGKGLASPPITSQTAGVQNELRSFADRLENTPQLVPAPELKKMLQQIDNSEKAMYGQPGFDGRVSRAYKMVRGVIDDGIKSKNPEYAAKMAEVAQNTGLLNDAISRFGDERVAVARLSGLGSKNAGADRNLLARLGQATGKDFQTPIEHYFQAQSTLKDPAAMEGIRQGLPEFQSAQKARSELRQISSPEAKANFIADQVRSTGLMDQQTAQQGHVSAAAENLASKKQGLSEIDPFGKLKQNQSQSAVESLFKNPGKENWETRKALERLGQASDKDFAQMIDDARVQASFKKGATNGSRNAVMFGSLGAAGGAMINGGTGGAIGLSVGTTIGGLVDRVGPVMAKKILNTTLKLSPTVDVAMDAISKLNDVSGGAVSAIGNLGQASVVKAASNPQMSTTIRSRLTGK